MTMLAQHRLWLGLAVLALVLIFGSAPLLQNLQEKALQHQHTVQAAQTQAQQSIRQLDEDIATVQKLSSQLNVGDAERVLALVDRLQIANLLEHQAAAQRLSHFTYSLSPEQRQLIDNPGAGPHELALSMIDLSADAPLDTDVYAFIDQVQQRLPGRVRVQKITLERITKNDNALTAANLRMTASLEWLSNGAIKSVAGGL